MESVTSYDCQLCDFKSPTRQLWLVHIRGVHKEDDNFRVVCTIEGYTAIYTKCSSFLSHCYRKHRNLLIVNTQEILETDYDTDIIEEYARIDQATRTEVNVCRSAQLDHQISYLMGTDTSFQMKKSALYILNLKEIRGLSETAIEHIIKETKEMMSHTVERISAGVGEHLSSNGIDVPESLAGVFKAVKDPFDGIDTIYLQEKFYREKFNCIDSVEVNIGPSHYVTKFCGSKRSKILQSDSIQYIPLEDTLKNLIQSSPEVLREINNYHGSDGEIMRDICDGSVFKDHPLFKANKTAIQIIAYYDEIELRNPLGSSSKKHKLGCLFFTIGNIHPKFRSQLKCTFVAAIGRNVVIRRHGINSFLQPFVNSIKLLSESGLQVCLNGIPHNYKVGLLAVLADTLAAHSIGGFKESMSFARRICRSCVATTEQIQNDFVENCFELRTTVKHNAMLRQLERDSSMSTEFGINFESVLTQIPNFSVVQNLPHDIMHDLLEGVVPYEMKLLLSYLSEKKLVSIIGLNDRLKRFDFGYTEKSDMPSPIDENLLKKPEKKIRQSASKMLLLATSLPLLIGDLIPEECEQYLLFLILLKICAIAMAWEISPGTIGYLQILIEEHHDKFKKLYPFARFIPKLHYMVHYPSQILRYGPLIYQWVMRHEAKLQTLKRAARHGNFKNISYTIAKKSQHALCYYLNCDDPFLLQPTELPISLVCISPTQDFVTFAQKSNFNIKSVQRTTWLKHGILYFKRFALVYTGREKLYPTFGKVHDILVLERIDLPSELLYIVSIQKCDTLYFDDHFNGYVISHLDTFYYENVLNLPCHPIIHSHQGFGKPELFLNLKHYVF